MSFKISARQFLAAVAIVCSAWMPARATDSFTKLVVFGDSLSDVGNVGRFTSGLLWDEHVAGAFGLTVSPSKNGGTIYAAGGALITADNGPIPSLPHQLDAYLSAHPKADPKALYVVWGGGNDLFSTLQNPGNGPAIQAAGITATLSMINRLYIAGARFIIVGEVPGTSYTPLVTGIGPAAVAQQAALTASWNKALRPALVALRLPGLHLLRYNSASAIAAIFNSPTHFGFTDLTTQCGSTCADPDHTFFWDSVHPGIVAHAAIAASMQSIATQ